MYDSLDMSEYPIIKDSSHQCVCIHVLYTMIQHQSILLCIDLWLVALAACKQYHTTQTQCVDVFPTSAHLTALLCRHMLSWSTVLTVHVPIMYISHLTWRTVILSVSHWFCVSNTVFCDLNTQVQLGLSVDCAGVVWQPLRLDLSQESPVGSISINDSASFGDQ